MLLDTNKKIDYQNNVSVYVYIYYLYHLILVNIVPMNLIPILACISIFIN